MMYLDKLGNAANIRRYLSKVQYPIGEKKLQIQRTSIQVEI
jgi:hypothetical protein